MDPLAAGRCDAKLRVYELLKYAKLSKKSGDKELYRAWAESLVQEWFLTRQEFGDDPEPVV